MTEHIETRAKRANNAATFIAPPYETDELPCIEVAGVVVFAYVRLDGTFAVSVHCDNADVELFPEWDNEVPVRVTGVDPDAIVGE